VVRRCSFCSRGEAEVQRLIAGPEGVFICNECVDLCRDILEGDVRLGGHAAGATRPTLPPQQIYDRLDEYVV